MVRQKGFSAVEGLVIVLILAVVGFAGWYVISADSDTDDEPTTMSSNETENQPETTEEPVVAEVETTILSNASFTVNTPETWNYRACMDHDGFALLVGGAGGEMRCIFSDATWLDTDMAARARVVIGQSSNPSVRNDAQGEDPLAPVESSAFALSDGRTAQKYEYTFVEAGTKDSPNYVSVVEYMLEDVTVMVFSGHSQEESLISSDLTNEQIISDVESVVLPSISAL